MDSWKEFDTVTVTHSVSHYLGAIAHLTEENGYARAVDVARYLEITRGSVSLALRTLKGRDLVLEDENRFLVLSEDGRRIVEQILARRRLVVDFLEGVLGVNPRQAEIDACKVEHLLSDEACQRLGEFLAGKQEQRQAASRS